MGRGKTKKAALKSFSKLLFLKFNGGADGTRTRDLQRDRLAF